MNRGKQRERGGCVLLWHAALELPQQMVCVRVCVCETQRAQEVVDEWRAEARTARPCVNHGPLLPASLCSWTHCLLQSLTVCPQSLWMFHRG